jgi:subtilase family serine protease
MLRKLLASLGLSLALGISLPVFAANPPQPRAGTRITEPIDGAKLVKLTGSTHPLANAQNDRGAVAASVPLNRMMLVLKRPAAQDKALAEAIKEMQRPGSATFHHWLTAEQIGAKYGPAQEDINKVSSWLTGSGFNVTSISRARGTIEFSGTAGQVASAFQTEIHHYAWQGATYTANAKDPSIPAALAPVVAGFVSLNNFPIKGAHTDAKVVKLDKSTHTWSVEAEKSSREEAALSKVAKPNLTTNNTNDGNTLYAVTPYDFATIYNLKPLWDAGIDGTGQQIAILAESDITPSDVDQFRSAFGLPAKKLNVIHNRLARPDRGLDRRGVGWRNREERHHRPGGFSIHSRHWRHFSVDDLCGRQSDCASDQREL